MRSTAWLWLALVVCQATACAEDPASPAAAERGAASKAPRDARDRGSDWPAFLGPTGDSKSTERGILTRWPAEGPPLVWQLPLGTGYDMPTISAGRLFQFDRVGRFRAAAVSRKPDRQAAVDV